MDESQRPATDDKTLCRLAMAAATCASRIRHGRGRDGDRDIVLGMADEIERLRDRVEADYKSVRWICSFVRDAHEAVPLTLDALKDDLLDVALAVRTADEATDFHDVVHVGLALHDVLLDRLDPAWGITA